VPARSDHKGRSFVPTASRGDGSTSGVHLMLSKSEGARPSIGEWQAAVSISQEGLTGPSNSFEIGCHENKT
jgi:hypothetical protein